MYDIDDNGEEEPTYQNWPYDNTSPLADWVTGQYAYWEKTGHIGYSDIDKDTPPYYQVTAIGINGSNGYAKIQILINGVDYGTYELDHRLLFLPVDSDPIVANKPATVELKLLEGQLPGEHQVFVYIMSAEQVATATCSHSFAVGICKNGFSEPILQNAGIIHCVFSNEYHDSR